ncbi:hypothetical protein O181_002525 [Austropuccinia psidii MF-1]|uniref:Uncharacterized protein n=1 Tax=Austropuccinia psidii MF-1 TaxID=1389203 RepID=A0A9Q3BD72_9BASI|nr:hypothetical protein [Austropuccinia psidii MF-1]
MKVDSEVEMILQKVTSTSKSPVELNPHREVPYLKVKSLKFLLFLSLDWNISHSNRKQSHSEVSNRHIYEPVQAVLHGVQGQVLGNVATNPPRSDELLTYSQNTSQREGNREILQ